MKFTSAKRILKYVNILLFNLLLWSFAFGNNGLLVTYHAIENNKLSDNYTFETILNEIVLTCNNPTADLFDFVTLPILLLNEVIQIVTPTGDVLSGSSETFIVDADLTGTYQINIINILTNTTIFSQSIDVSFDTGLPDMNSIGILTNVSLTCDNPVINILDGLTLPAELDGIAVISVVDPDGNNTVVTDGNYLVSEPGDYEVIIENSLTGCAASVVVTVGEETDLPDLTNLGILTSVSLTCENTVINILDGLNIPAELTGIAVVKVVDPSGTTTVVTDGNFPVITAGDYEVIIENSLTGCAASVVVTVGEETDLPNLTNLGILTSVSLTCENTIINILDGLNIPAELTGIAVVKVVDPSGTTTVVTDGNFPVITPGDYEVIIENSLTGCAASVVVTVGEETDLPDLTNLGILTSVSLTCENTIINILDGLNIPAELSGIAVVKVVDPSGTTTVVTDGNFPVITAGDYEVIIENSLTGCAASVVVTVGEETDLPDLTNLGLLSNVSLTCENTIINILDGLNIPAELSGIAVVKVVDPSGTTTVVTDGNFPVITAGDYEVIIENSLTGCAASVVVTVGEETDLPDLTNLGLLSNVSLTCENTIINILDGLNIPAELTGIAVVKVVDPSGTTTVVTDGNFPVITAGDYEVIIENSLTGCAASVVVTVGEETDLPNLTNLGILTNVSLTCENTIINILDGLNIPAELTGIAVVKVVDPSGTTTVVTDGNFPVITAGDYEVIIENSLTGCAASVVVTVGEETDLPNIPAIPNIELTCEIPTVNLLENLILSPELTGIVVIKVIAPDGQTTTVTDGNFSVGQAGEYEILVENSLTGCAASIFVTVSEATDLPNIPAIPNIELTCEIPTVNLLENLILSPELTGIAVIKVIAPDGQTTTVTDGNFSVGQAGEYEILVENSLTGCAASIFVTVSEATDLPNIPAIPNIELTCEIPTVNLLENLILSPELTGIAVIKVIAPDGQTTTVTDGNFSVGQAGEYEILVENSLTGCAASIFVTVSEATDLPNIPAIPNIELTCEIPVVNLLADLILPAELDGIAVIKVIAPDGQITTVTDGNFSVGQAGEYEILVENSLTGCAASIFVTVSEATDLPNIPAIPNIELTCEFPTVNLLENLILSPELTGIAVIKVIAPDGQTTTVTDGNFSVGQAGEYEILVENSLTGCAASIFVTVSEATDLPNIPAIPNIELTCEIPVVNLLADLVLPAELDGIAVIKVIAPDGQTTTVTDGNFSVGQAGEYEILVENSLTGCAASIFVTVSEATDLPNIPAIPNIELTCEIPVVNLLADLVLPAELTGIAVIKVIAPDGQTTTVTDGNFSVGQAGEYEILVENSLTGCAASIFVTVSEATDLPNIPAIPNIELTCEFPTVNLLENLILSPELTGIAVIKVITPDGQITTVTDGNFSVGQAGEYEILVENSLTGCAASIFVTVSEATDLPNIPAIPNIELTCEFPVVNLLADLVLPAELDGIAVIKVIAPDGQITTITDGNFSVGQAGEYEILVENSLTGCAASIFVTVSEATDLPNIPAIPNIELTCEFPTVNLLENLILSPELTGIVVIKVIAPDGQTTTVTDGNFSVGQAGEYEILVENSLTGCAASIFVTVSEATDLPNIPAIPNIELTCEIPTVNLLENLILSPELTGIAVIKVIAPDGQTTTVTDGNFSVGQAGEYEILVENSLTGCAASIFVTVSEATDLPNIPAIPNIELTCEIPVVNLLADLVLPAELDGIAVIKVIAPDGQTTTVTDGNFSVGQAGEYEILVENSLTGCAASIFVTVSEATDLPNIPAIPNIELTCEIPVVNLLADLILPAELTGIAVIKVIAPDGQTTTVTDGNFSVGQAGEYEILVENSLTGCAASIFVTVSEATDLPNIPAIPNIELTCEFPTVNLLENLILSPELTGIAVIKVIAPDGQTTTVTDGNFSVGQAGEYEILVENSLTGCAASIFVTVSEATDLPNIPAIPNIELTCEFPTVNLLENLILSPELTGIAVIKVIAPDGQTTTVNDGNFSVGQAGEYEILVENSLTGCAASIFVTVSEATDLPNIPAIPNIELTCEIPTVNLLENLILSPELTGIAVIKVIAPDGQITTATDGNFSVGQAGEYEILVENSLTGCAASIFVTVSEATDLPNIPAIPNIELTCEIPVVNLLADLVLPAELDGIAVIKVIAPDGQTTTVTDGNFSVGQAGEYEILVENSLTGCAASIFVTVSEATDLSNIPAIPNIELTCEIPVVNLLADLVLPAELTGTAVIKVIAPDGQTTTVTDGNFSVGQAGEYEILVENSLTGCAASIFVTVSEATDLPNIPAIPNIELTCEIPVVNLLADLILPAELDGIAVIKVIAPDGQTTTVTDGNFSVGQAGEYEILVENSLTGCAASIFVTVSEATDLPNIPAIPNIELTCEIPVVNLLADLILPAELDGIAVIKVIAPDGQITTITDGNFSVGQAGEYEILVENSLTGCAASIFVTVSEATDLPNIPAIPNIELTCEIPVVNLLADLILPAELDGIAVIKVIAPDGQITTITDGNFSVGQAGEYEILVENSLTGCAASIFVTVSEATDLPNIPAIPNIELTCEFPVVNLLADLVLPVELDGIAVIKVIAPDGQITTATDGNFSVGQAGEYEILVENSLTGCAASIFVTVSEATDLPNIPAIPNIELTCEIPVVNLLADLVLPAELDGIAVIKVIAPDGQTTTVTDGNFSVGQAGEYEILVENSLTGCAASIFVTVSEATDLPNIPAIPNIELTCEIPVVNLLADLVLPAELDGIAVIKVIAPDGQITTITDGNFSVGQAGEYEILVENSLTGCAASIFVTVSEATDLPNIPAIPNIELTCEIPVVNLLADLVLPAELDGIAVIKVIAPDGQTTTVTDGNFSVGQAGEYEILVENSLTGCAASIFVTVSEATDLPNIPAIPNIELTCEIPVVNLLADLILPAELTGIAVIKVIAPDGQTTTVTDGNFSVGQAGEYEILVENSLTGCAASIFVTVSEATDLPNIPAIPNIELTCEIPVVNLLADLILPAELDGIAVIKVIAPDGQITTITDGNFSVGQAGEYEILVENSLTGCAASIFVTVSEATDLPNIPAIPNIELTCEIPVVNLLADLILPAELDGIAVIKVIAPDGQITTITDGNFSVGQAGEYEILVENSLTGCAASIFVTVSEATDLPNIPAIPNIELTCEFPVVNLLADLVLPVELDGIAVIKVIAPDGQITTATDGNFSVGQAGEYEILVENSLTGCAASITVNVFLDDNLPMLNPIETVVLTCTNPSVDLLAGWSLPTDLEDNAVVQVIDLIGVTNTLETLTYNVSEAGNYTIIVTNVATGCASTINGTVENAMELPEISGLPAQFTLNCYEQTETLSGDVNMPIDQASILLIQPDGTMSQLETLDFSVSQIGTYTLELTNNLTGCNNSFSVVVDQPTALLVEIFSTSETANGANDGTAGLNISGGTLPYEVLWNTGQTETNLTNLTAGSYSVTVTDANGCTKEATVTVDVDNEVECNLSVQFMVEPISCEGANDGSIRTVISDGLDPISYFWSTGATTSMIDELSPGTYSVTTTDANLCSASETVTILEPDPVDPPETDNTTSADNPACVGNMVQLFTPFVPNAIYEWAGPNGYISTEQNPIIEAVNLNNAGDYHAYVSINQCTVISETTTVFIKANPSSPILPEIISVCEDENVIINVVNWVDTFPENSVQFEWYFNNSIVQTTLEPRLTFDNITANQSGDYQAIMIVDGCSSLLSNITTVEVSVIPNGVIADAGEDQEVCENNTVLNAVNPTVGIGVWTSLTGATVANPQNPQTEVSNLQTGENFFIWTLSNGNCTNFSIDTIIVTRSSTEDIAFAGDDQSFCIETNPVTKLEASVPTIATGLWTQSIAQQNQGVVIVNPTTPDTEILGLIAGNTYSFTWTLSNGICQNYSSDQVLLSVSTIPSNTAFIPENEIIYCGTGSVIAAAEIPSTGEGHWYTLTGATIADAENPRTIISDLTPGENVLIWTLSNSGCQDYSVDTLKVYYEDGFEVYHDTVYVDHNDTLENINLILNDSLTNLTNWNYFPVSNPQHGDILNHDNGMVTYAPDKYYFGEDHFEYKICSDQCPSSCDTAMVKVKVDKIYFAGDCDIPNVMTPNGDGLNDTFYIPCVDQFPDSELTVFNRWGDKVFETVAYNNTWEGTYKNQPLPEGTYYFFLILEPSIDLRVRWQGYVTIFR